VFGGIVIEGLGEALDRSDSSPPDEVTSEDPAPRRPS